MVIEHNLEEGLFAVRALQGGTASTKILISSGTYHRDLAFLVISYTHPASSDDAVLEGKIPLTALDSQHLAWSLY